MIAAAALSPGRAPPTLEELCAVMRPLIGQLRVEIDPSDRQDWIDRASLGDPDAYPLADLYARFVAAGFGANQRAVAASLLLRFGWAAGFTIGAWLSRGVIVLIEDYALKFSPMTLVEGIWIKKARIAHPADPAEGRAMLAAELRAFSADVVERQHCWSRFSRHALWAMVTSSWAAQFAAIGERLGQRAKAVAEARLLLGSDAMIAAAAPDMYEVCGERGSEICQRRAACCLYFKGPRHHFCASCPIIPAAERLARNRQWADRALTEGRA